MPHKHTRKGTDSKDHDLPPTKAARPLPVGPSRDRKESATSTAGSKRKRGRNTSLADDAPRAFKRMMAFAQGQRLPSGLDNGIRSSTTKKAKKGKKGGKEQEDQGGQEGRDESKEAQETKEEEAEDQPAAPTIRPGESMSDFAARVDAALPVSGLIAKGGKGKDPLGLKVYRTRKEKKMHKLYDQWRAEERKIQERREEELELVAERELENATSFTTPGVHYLGDNWDVAPKDDATGKKKKKKKKQKRGKGGRGKDEEDPWEELRRKRGESKVRLRDVAQAPPTLPKVSEKLPLQVS